jgi:hypothetical protein
MSVIVPIMSTFNDKGIKSAVREFQTAKTKIDKFGAVGKVFEGVGKSLTRNLTAPIMAGVGVLTLLAKGAEEAEIANKKLGSVLTSMGFGEATHRVSEYAEQLERTLAIDADVIKATQMKLATFKNLTASVNESGGAFDRATMAALDLAAAGFGEAETNAVQLGKALQDPIKGITALSRSGVTFTDQEKKKIKTLVESNRVLEAQNLILSAIEEQVGGTALAGASAFERIRLSLLQVGDEIGMAVLPLIQQLADFISNKLVPMIVPKIKTVVEVFKNLSDRTKMVLLGIVAFAAGIGPLLIVIGVAIKAVVALSKAFLLLFKTKILIPLLVVALIGAFRAQSDAQYQLAKESGQTWKQIAIVIEKGIHFAASVIQEFINGLMVLELAFDHVGRKVDNFFNILAGKPADSLLTFKERLRTLVQQRFFNFADNIDGLSESIIGFVNEFSEIHAEFEAAQNTMKDTEASIEALQKEIGNLGDGSAKSKEKIAKLKSMVQEFRQAAVKAAQAVVDNLNDSLQKAQSQLDETRGKFNQLKDAIAGNIQSIVNFGKAAEGENFLEGLIGQAADATSFANKVKQLIQLGLSERGIEQVLSAGFEAGTKIADELIAGGSTIVQQVNTLLASVQSVADQVGDFGARQFYQAGITQGEALVNGILDALRQAQAELAAAVKAASQGGDIRTFGARATNLIDAIGGISGSKKQANALAAFEAALAGSGKISKKEDAQIRSRFKLAKGGIVLGRKDVTIGEAGPEAVIPLSGANSARGAMGTTINITVNAGIGTSGSQVGQQIVDAIKKYERTSGAVFASA